MPELRPPPSISDLRAQGIYAIIARLGALDLTPLLVYTVTYAPESALKWLAWQFDVLDPQWQLLAGPAGESIDALTNPDELTDIDTLDSPGSEAGPSDWDTWRYLLRVAIPLHSKVGTVGTIKTVLKALGWANVTLMEGQNSWGGNSWPADQGWAVCRILINLGATDTVSVKQVADIISAFNFFKPARCWLDSVWFVSTYFPSDELIPAPSDFLGIGDFLIPAPSDAWTVVFPGVSDVYSSLPIHDAHWQHAGITYANQPVGPTDGASTFNGVPVEGNA